MKSRCIVFDFDGTLAQSDHIKRETFFEVLDDYVGSDKLLSERLDANPIATRYEVFTHMEARLREDGHKLESGISRSWVDEYTRRCEERIIACNEVKGAGSALKTLQTLGWTLFINSATPRDALNPILMGRGIDCHFSGVYGAPTDKASNLRDILEKTGLSPEQTVLVGNGESDREAAVEVGVRFVAIGKDVDGEGIEARLPDLTTLTTLLEGY